MLVADGRPPTTGVRIAVGADAPLGATVDPDGNVVEAVAPLAPLPRPPLTARESPWAIAEAPSSARPEPSPIKPAPSAARRMPERTCATPFSA